MKRQIQAGKTDYSALVFIPDPASTDGSGKTGLVAANLTVSGVRMETDNDATVIDYTSTLNDLSALTDTHADWGLKEISNTLAPGLYRLDIADAIFASGAWTAVVYVMITTSAAAASPMEFIIVAHDPDDLGTKQGGDNFARLGAPAGASVSADIAAAKTDTAAIKTKTDFLPSATAGAAGGVFIAGSNAATSITTALTANVIGNVTGNLSGSVGSVTGAVGSVTGAVGSVTGNVGGNVTGSVGSVATGGIAAASFAAGAIDAAAIATDAIDADAIKADAVTEIQAGLSTLNAAGVRTAVGLATANLDTQLGAIDDFVDTEMAAALAILVKLNTTIESTGSPTDYVFTSRALAQAPSGTGASATAIADEVQTRTIAGVTLVATTTNLTNAPTNGDLTATMKASVTTAATAATPIAASVTGAVGSVTGNVGGNVTGSVGSVVGAVGSVTGGVTVTTNNDKTGYGLSSGERTTLAGVIWATVMEGSRTAIQYMRGFGAALLGKASGMATTTATFRDVDDSKDRIVATVDADGNRSAITLDLT